MAEFARKTPKSSLQRKNLLQARLFDDEVQQEIFPAEDKKNPVKDVSIEHTGGNVEAIHNQRGVMEKLDTAIGDLTYWKNARRNTDMTRSTSELNFDESENDDVRAKLSAFIEKELSLGTDESNDTNRTWGGMEQKSEGAKERLQALIKEGEARTKVTDIVDLSSLSLQNQQMTHLKSTNLGSNFQGEKKLEATKDELLSQLEAQDAAFEKLQAQLNASWSEELDDILNEPRK